VQRLVIVCIMPITLVSNWNGGGTASHANSQQGKREEIPNRPTFQMHQLATARSSVIIANRGEMKSVAAVNPNKLAARSE
jgi:hypothetical protein